MFQNRNNKVIYKIVKKILRVQRLRNIIAIVAIFLTALLFTSMSTMLGGIQKSQKLMMQIQAGTKADVEIKGMTKEQYDKLTNESIIKEAGLRRSIDYLTNTNHHNIELDYLDSRAQEYFFCKPTHGREPQRENEIATSDIALKDLGVDLNTGEKVNITFEIRGQSGKIYSYDMVVSGWWEGNDKQNSIMLVSEEFMNKYGEEFTEDITGINDAGKYSAEIILKSKKDIREQINQAIYAIGGNPQDQTASNYIVGVINEDTTTDMLEILPAVIILGVLFAVCGYLLIFNIFDISVVKDIRVYGLLSTIGTTPLQIKKIVIRQVILLSAIGIPLGLLGGYLLGLRLLPIAMKGLDTADYTSVPIVYSVNPFIFIISSIITFITICVSVYKPAKLASQLTVVDAAKFNEFHHKKKTSNNKGKPWKIAFANFNKNKRRSVFIIVSLSLCIILFNSIFVFIFSLDIDKFVKAYMKTDYIIANTDAFNLNKGFISRENGLSIDMVNYIKQMQEVKSIGYLYKNTQEDEDVSFDYGIEMKKVETYVNNKGDNVNSAAILYNGMTIGVILSKDGRAKCNVYGVLGNIENEFKFDHTLDEMPSNQVLEQFESGNYIIEGAACNPNNPTEVDPNLGYQCKIGQKITAYKNGEPYKTYTVIAQIPVIQSEVETNNGMTGAIMVGQDGPKFYLPYQEFEELYDSPTLLNCTFNVDEGYKEKVSKEIETYISTQDPQMSYFTSDDLINQIKSEGKKLYLVGGTIAFILGIAGIINFANLTITSIVSRRREFAVMESIGMTEKQLIRMLLFEGLYYAGATGVVGIVFTEIIGVSIIKKVVSLEWYYTFKMVLFPSIGIWLMMLGIVLVISAVSMKLFNSGNLSDRLSQAD